MTVTTQPDALRRAISDGVTARATELIEISHQIHGHPELAFEEHRSAQLLAEKLAAEGFDVELGACDLETAVIAESGSGDLTVAICAEYDALPGIGHACGHNIIAAAATGAAVALASVADEAAITVRLVGTPAEEGGGGKILMLDRGAFDGAHAAMMIHPGPVDLPFMPTLATTGLDVRYVGTSAHASAFPELGVNAADAATVAQVAIGLLRQHLAPQDRIHGIVTDGGTAPNVVPAHTALKYMVRARDMAGLQHLEERLRACFQAGALATGCAAEFERAMPTYAELTHDNDLTAAYRANAERAGRQVRDVTAKTWRAAGSTDMGNVSQRLPTIHPMIGLGRDRGSPHQPEFAEAAVSPEGDKAVLDGAIALAWTVLDAATRPQIRERLLA